MNKKASIDLITGWDNEVKNPIDFKTSLIGQPEVARKLNFFVASHSPETPIPTMLFSGSQGLGKTYTSNMVSKAMGREIVEVNCGGLDDRNQLFDDILLTKVHGWSPVTLLFDEAHKLSREVATELLTITNPNDNFCNTVDYKNFNIVFDMSKINIIFATTDANRLLRPLVNRCEEIYFNLYSHTDLLKILNLYLDDCRIKVSRKVAIDIGYACRGRARTAFLLAQNIRRYCKINNTNVMTSKGWLELSQVFGIHPLGLNNKEIKLMKILHGGACDFLSCGNLAIKLGVTEDNVKDEWEQRPKELGLVQSTSKGRSLTGEGVEYLKDMYKKEREEIGLTI